MSSQLTTEQRYLAIQSLADPARVGLFMRPDGTWYAVSDLGVGVIGGVLYSKGEGATPFEAIAKEFLRLTELKPNEYVIKKQAKGFEQSAYRWNGFMWTDCTEEAKR